MGAANHRTAASELKLPIWVSWTLDERQPKLRSGQSIGTALEVLHNAGLLSATEDHSIISALMFNCTSPEVITLALRCEQPTVAFASNFVFEVLTLTESRLCAVPCIY